MANLFSNLKSFCTTIEQDSQRIKREISSKQQGTATHSTDDFVAGLKSRTEALESSIRHVEDTAFGPAELRLSVVSTQELLEKCKAMFAVNESIIQQLEEAASKRTVTTVIPRSYSAAPASNVLKAMKKDEKIAKLDEKENIRNGLAQTKPVMKAKPLKTVLKPPQRSVKEVKSILVVTSPVTELMPDTSMCDNNEVDAWAAIGDDDNDDNDNDDDVGDDGHDDNEEEINSEGNEADGMPIDTSLSSEEGGRAVALSPDPPVGREGILGSDGNPKTPVLATWKLSEATRSLFQQSDAMCRRDSVKKSSDHKSPSKLKQPSSRGQASKMSHSQCLTPASPLLSPSFGNFQPLRPPQATTESVCAPSQKPIPTITSSQPTGFSTPVHASSHIPVLCDVTPKTPSLGTPFVSCALRQLVDMEDGVAKSEGTNQIHNEQDSSMSLDKSQRTSSPLKIPNCIQLDPVQHSEWDSAPAFLRIQISLPDLNVAVAAINSYLTTTSSDSKKSLSLTLPQIEQVLAAASCAGSKVVLLGLVQMKRLDLGTDKGVKVYKLKQR